MAFKHLRYLKSLLRCPDTLRKIYWIGQRGYALGCKRRIVEKDHAFIFVSDDLPEDYDRPQYESRNPYQLRSLELIEEHRDGIVVDLGSGNPKHSFDNVCQIEMRKYSHTDIVVTDGRVPLKSSTIDAVISGAVLEHVKNPFLYISEIFRILKPEGKVLLDTAFMQPLHGYPYHYFNTTSYAVKLLFEKFQIDKLYVGAHQHPWIMLEWILHAYYHGLQSDDEREEFKKMTVGEMMSTLKTHQELRAVVKSHDDPWLVAQKLKSFNIDHAQSLHAFINITDACEEELAAGFQIHATKPKDGHRYVTPRPVMTKL